MMTLEGHKEAISSLVWLSQGELVSASWDHTMILWDMEHAIQKSTLVSYYTGCPRMIYTVFQKIILKM